MLNKIKFTFRATERYGLETVDLIYENGEVLCKLTNPDTHVSRKVKAERYLDWQYPASKEYKTKIKQFRSEGYKEHAAVRACLHYLRDMRLHIAYINNRSEELKLLWRKCVPQVDLKPDTAELWRKVNKIVWDSIVKLYEKEEK